MNKQELIDWIRDRMGSKRSYLNEHFEKEKQLRLDIWSLEGEEKRIAVKRRAHLSEENRKEGGMLKAYKIVLNKIENDYEEEEVEEND